MFGGVRHTLVDFLSHWRLKLTADFGGEPPLCPFRRVAAFGQNTICRMEH